MELLQAQVANFCQAQPAGIGCFENGVGTECLRGGFQRRFQQPSNLRLAQCLGHPTTPTRQRQVLGRIAGDMALLFSKPKKGPQGSDLQIQAGGAEPRLGRGLGFFQGSAAFMLHVPHQLVGIHAAPGGDPSRRRPFGESLEERLISPGRVRGQSPLMAQMDQELLNERIQHRLRRLAPPTKFLQREAGRETARRVPASSDQRTAPSQDSLLRC